jgi:hypothetical protein
MILAFLYAAGIVVAFPALTALFLQAPGIEWWRALAYALGYAIIWPYPLRKWFT